MTLLTDLDAQTNGSAPQLSFDEALAVLDLSDAEVPELVALAHRVRIKHAGPEVEVESIISAKTGGCPEDCSFCSQSRHWPTPVRPEPFIDIPPLVEAAKRSQQAGATEFCIVLAIRGPDERIMEQVLAVVDALHGQTDMHVACSLGILTREQARRLKDAGVRRYNHNLETAKSHFPKICTTHTWEERWETCELVQELGMELCCGGIFGMGETTRQRVEFAFELRELGPREIPMNFLNPRPGTPLGDRDLVNPLDAIRTIALFRLLFPEIVLRYAGGREVTLRELQAMGLYAGINGIIIGNYLTTLGRSPADDLAMLSDVKMPLKSLGI
ncbi:MAG: biotin synthase BioB [Actinomycetota bacterium]